MLSSIPLIKISNNADALRIRCPDRETCSRHAVNLSNVRAEFFVDAPFITRSEQIQILFAERRKKGIRIARLPESAVVICDDEIVGIDFAAVLRGALENSVGVNLLKFNLWLFLFVSRTDFHLSRAGQKRARHHAGTVAERMHSQKRVRRAMLNVNETVEFCLRQNHQCELNIRIKDENPKKFRETDETKAAG